MSKSPQGGRGGVLDTGLSILEALGRSQEPLTVTELARELDADKGNVHRIARLLQDRGYVHQDADTKRYELTTKIIELSGRVLRHLDVRTVAEPVLRWLQAETGESVHLALRTTTGGVYIAQERAPSRVSVETQIGSQPPVHCTATGKALYADATADDLDRVLPEQLPRHTIRTITSRRALLTALAEVRQQGYAVDDEEYNVDVRCVAAPIYDARGRIVASIGFSGPGNRMTVELLPEAGALVREAADRVTRGLGGQTPGGKQSQQSGPKEVSAG